MKFRTITYKITNQFGQLFHTHCEGIAKWWKFWGFDPQVIEVEGPEEEISWEVEDVQEILDTEEEMSF